VDVDSNQDIVIDLLVNILLGFKGKIGVLVYFYEFELVSHILGVDLV
jgi:hypothetical protein